jgi:hypothetical protein
MQEAKKAMVVEIPGHKRELELPQAFELEDIRRAQRDCEILSEKLQGNTDEIREFLNELLRGDTRDAKRRARELGLSVNDFVSRGGGIFWLIVLAGVLYSTAAY